MYCLNFFPISFLESLRVTDQPAGRGPLEEMPGELKAGGLPGPLLDGLPGFRFFTSSSGCSSLRFLPGLADAARSAILAALSRMDRCTSGSLYVCMTLFRLPALLPASRVALVRTRTPDHWLLVALLVSCVPTRMSYPESST